MPLLVLDDVATAVLIAHQRQSPSQCACGWSEWGASHAAHVWRMLRLAGVTYHGKGE